jgi:elongation factor Ts
MADVSMEKIKDLRERTSAGVMDCKRALEQAGGDMEKAERLLAEWGMAAAGKKAHRVTAQGLVETYIHAGGRIGVIVEVNCETDFVARTDEFRNLAHEVAMQVAAQNPLVVAQDDLPAGFEGLPTEAVLLLQPYIRDPSKSIRDLVNEAIGKTGENIVVRRFARFEIGEEG